MTVTETPASAPEPSFEIDPYAQSHSGFCRQRS